MSIYAFWKVDEEQEHQGRRLDPTQHALGSASFEPYQNQQQTLWQTISTIPSTNETFQIDSVILPMYLHSRKQKAQHKPYRRSAICRTTSRRFFPRMSPQDWATTLPCYRSFWRANPRKRSETIMLLMKGRSCLASVRVVFSTNPPLLP